MSGVVFVKPAKFVKHDFYFGAIDTSHFLLQEYDAGSELNNGKHSQ